MPNLEAPWKMHRLPKCVDGVANQGRRKLLLQQSNLGCLPIQRPSNTQAPDIRCVPRPRGQVLRPSQNLDHHSIQCQAGHRTSADRPNYGSEIPTELGPLMHPNDWTGQSHLENSELPIEVEPHVHPTPKLLPCRVELGEHLATMSYRLMDIQRPVGPREPLHPIEGSSQGVHEVPWFQKQTRVCHQK